MDANTKIKLLTWSIFAGIIASWIGIFFITRAIGGNIIALCVAIFLLLLITIGSACFCVKAKKEMYKVRNHDLHKKLYSLIDSFDKLCTKHDVGYWITGGTLLGAIRHQGIIPWDDDLDISMTQEQYDKLRGKMVIADMKQTGYMIKTSDICKYGKITEQVSSEFGFTSWIDIFIMREAGNKYEYAAAISRSIWPDEWFYKSEIEKLKRYRFGKLMLPAPVKATDYLKRTYGSDWKQPKVTHTHTASPYEYLRVFYSNIGLR